RLMHRIRHCSPVHGSHSWISAGVHFLVKHPQLLALGIFATGRRWLFSTKMGVVWPLIVDQTLIHLTPHMFPCHKSHSWISGGDHFLVKNSYVLVFGIIENGRSWLFSAKWGLCGHLSSIQGLNASPHISFLDIMHRPVFNLQNISLWKICICSQVG